MGEHNTPLAAFYRGWETYQELLARAVAPLTVEQLGLRAAPHLRSIGEQAAHVIAARVYWFHYVLREGSRDLAPMVHWDDDGAPARSAGELASGLEATWTIMQSALERWTADDLDATFTRPRRPGEQYSRQWVIWHVIEHDLHHGGELSLALGMHGLAGIDL